MPMFDNINNHLDTEQVKVCKSDKFAISNVRYSIPTVLEIKTIFSISLWNLNDSWISPTNVVKCFSIEEMCEAPVTDDIEDEDEEDDEEMTQHNNFQLQDEGKEVVNAGSRKSGIGYVVGTRIPDTRY